MNLKGDSGSPWFKRIALIVCIISSSVVLVILSKLDYLINSDLYRVGQLQFSEAWYNPYKTYLWLIEVFLVLSITISSLVLALEFIKKVEFIKKAPNAKEIVPEKTIAPEPQQKTIELPDERTDVAVEKGKNFCPTCQRTFEEPSVVLEVRDYKPELMKTCPYCNSRWEPLEETKKSETTPKIKRVKKHQKKRRPNRRTLSQ